MHEVTVGSAWELVIEVVESLMRMSREHTREVRPPHSMSSPVRVVVRAPDLTGTIRRHRDPSLVAFVDFQTLSPDLEAEYQALANQLPALEPPLRESFATEAEWLTADEAHLRRWEAWREAHLDEGIDAYHRACDRRIELDAARRQLRKEFTVAVGRDSRPQPLSKKFMRALRDVETWRRKPERPDPLEALIDDKPSVRLKAQGKFEEAAALEASTQRLAAQLASRPAEVQRRRQAREPWAEKKLWMDPDQTPVDDVRCELVLYLLQEQMIACSTEVSDFLQCYMRQFSHAMTKDEHDLLPRPVQLKGGGERFDAIRKGFAYPEHRKGFRSYIAHTLHGLSASAAREAVEQGGPHSGPSLALTAPYAVDDIVRLLQVESGAEVWTPTRRTLYYWIKTGKIRTVHSKKKALIPEEGLEQIRALVQEQCQKKALKAYYIETGIMKRNKDPVEAAKKRMQRHRKRGESVEDIARAIRRGHKASGGTVCCHC